MLRNWRRKAVILMAEEVIKTPLANLARNIQSGKESVCFFQRCNSPFLLWRFLCHGARKQWKLLLVIGVNSDVLLLNSLSSTNSSYCFLPTLTIFLMVSATPASTMSRESKRQGGLHLFPKRDFPSLWLSRLVLGRSSWILFTCYYLLSGSWAFYFLSWASCWYGS